MLSKGQPWYVPCSQRLAGPCIKPTTTNSVSRRQVKPHGERCWTPSGLSLTRLPEPCETTIVTGRTYARAPPQRLAASLARLNHLLLFVEYLKLQSWAMLTLAKRSAHLGPELAKFDLSPASVDTDAATTPSTAD